MNTHDKYELPPLPYWSRYDDLGGRVPSEIREGFQEYARAAIEADRKRQGDSAKVLAELVALIPLADTLNASASCQDLIDYFKGVIADRQRRSEPAASAIQSSLDQKIFDAAAKENDLVRLYIRETEANQYSTDAHRALNDLYGASATLRELLIEYLNSNEASRAAEPVKSTLPDGGIDADGFFAQLKAEKTTEPVSQHPDDVAVDAFAAAMKAKLAKKRAEGRGNWQMCTSTYLSRLLREHVEKGDPVDVANLAMMLHQNGQKIEPVKPVHEPRNLVTEYSRYLRARKQPEPVKVLSDADAKHVQDFINCDGMGAMVVEGPQYSAVVRALLARYTNQESSNG